jgi:hypothetical protein
MAPAPVRFTYTWDDYVALNRVLRRESFWKRNQLVLVPVLLTGTLLAGVVAITAWNGHDVGRALRIAFTTWPFWLLPPFLIVLILIFNRLELGMWYRRQKVDGLEVRSDFDDPQGLRFHTMDGSGVIAWSAIRKVGTDSGVHVVLQRNRMTGVCLPRRAFSSDVDFDAAKAHIERKVEDKRSAAP